MTKIISKKYLRAFLSTVSMVSLMSPMFVLAKENGSSTSDSVKLEDGANDSRGSEERTSEQQSGDRRGKIEDMRAEREAKLAELKDKRQGDFCSRFTDQAAKISENLSDRGGKFESRINDRSEERDSKRNEREGKLEENRSQADALRNEMFMKLEEKADTDAKKEALATFKKAVESAISLRREKVDAAIADFRKGVDSALATRKDGRAAALAAFKKDVDAAVAEAKAGCDSGKSPETIRATFKTSLKNARTTLQSQRQENNQIKDQILALVAARKTTVKAALDEFKSSIAAARADLKKAFGEIEKPQTENETPETPEAPETPAQ